MLDCALPGVLIVSELLPIGVTVQGDVHTGAVLIVCEVLPSIYFKNISITGTVTFGLWTGRLK